MGGVGALAEEHDMLLGVYLANRAGDMDIPGLPEARSPTLNLVPLRVRAPLGRGLRALAEDAEADLALVGARPGRACTALWEVDAWAGGAVLGGEDDAGGRSLRAGAGRRHPAGLSALGRGRARAPMRAPVT